MTSMRSFARPGEPQLSYWIDTPDEPARGRVLLVHGYADHSARYDHVVDVWRARGLTVARFDLRGHGRSEGPRGHVAQFAEYVGDVRALLDKLSGEPEWQATGASARPPALFGHSLGGLIASHAALALGSQIGGLALTSPFFGLGVPVPAVKAALARIVARVAPGLRQPSGLSGADMTHDAQMAKQYDADPLSFHHATVGWFTQASRAQTELAERAPGFTTPCFCIAGGDDHVVSVPATRRFFDLIGSVDKELDVRPGLFHEVLNEPDYREHAGRLADFMLRWTQA